MKNSKRLLPLAVAAAISLPTAAFATNGMNLEGYGPIATGMGGASMAYDNGTAAMMNNPATLGMMDGSRLDVAVGMLGPDVKSEFPPVGATSKATAFYMPAVGWAKRDNQLSYGVGVFAQGGMGTRYSSSSFLAAIDANGNPIDSKSFVAFGRLMAPIAYQVNDKLNVGGSVDYVFASMNLVMAMQKGAFIAQNVGLSGTLAPAFGGMANTDTAGFKFDNGSDFMGKATGNGFAGKLGFTYKASPELTIGGVYQSETAISDLSASGQMNMLVSGTPSSIPGTFKVKNFQWPATYGLGAAFKASDKVLLAADVKQIQWSSVMKDFKLDFSSAAGTLNVTIPQDWKDQTVVSLGGTFNANENLALRLGYNHANNPIPDKTMLPFFPAITEDHYTLGAGYAFNKAQSVDASITFAPKVSAGPDAAGIKSSMSQTNYQVMYSHRF